MLGCKKEEAILALLTNRTVEDAARACNKRARTLYRWLSEPEFKTAYREARRSAFSQSLARLQQGLHRCSFSAIEDNGRCGGAGGGHESGRRLRFLIKRQEELRSRIWRNA
jgi:hypothetical protein